MPKTNPLIRTKLRLPFIRQSLVSRARLQSRIMEGLRGPLTLVTAPAGFGKTTLVASCLTGCGMPVAWLSLDKNDNQAGRFLSYLVAALHGANNAIGVEAAQMLDASQEALPDSVLSSLVNDLDSAVTEMVLVLDDYQFVNNHAVHGAMAFLLDHCPKTLHLVIASRSDPQLPLSRLRTRGQTVELRAADLRFTQSEAGQFLNDVMDLCLDSGSVAALSGRTEGWIAGLQMAALSMRDREDVGRFITGFSGTNRYILDYLIEEVLASQPLEIQQFLLFTSILDRLTAPLCEAVTGDCTTGVTELESERSSPLQPPLAPHSPCQPVLDYLERANLFLLPLDDERQWYRYHHLFADLLRSRLQQSQPDLVPHLHLRAAAWLEQEGFIGEAVQHLFAAGEISQAAELIERYGPARLAENDPSVMLMAQGLPHEMILARPIIGLHQAWLLIIRARIDKALPLLHDLKRQLSGVGPGIEQRWIRTFVQSALAFLSPPPGSPGFEPLPEYSLLDEIPSSEMILRTAADILYGMALERRGELDRAVEVAIRCIQREKAPHEAFAIPTLAPFLSRVYLMQGRLRACSSLCREFLDPIHQGGVRYFYTSGGESMKIDLGEVLYEWDRLDQAEEYIRDGLRANEAWQNIMTDGFGLAALALVLQAKGDYAGAMQTAQKFESRLKEHAHPREFDEYLRTLSVRVQLAGGDIQSVSLWSEGILLSDDFQVHQDLYRLTLARIRLVQGRFSEVEEILSWAAPTMVAGSRISKQLESNLLLAAAHAGQQLLADAFERIESCLALAEQEGYVRVFLELGEPARDLLAAYLRSPSPGHKQFAQKILQSFHLSNQEIIPHPPEIGLVEPLTGRELEVLHLIAEGRTNKQIATQLIVSLGTVKAHTASIFRKLDVANRTEAVSQARHLGMIP